MQSVAVDLKRVEEVLNLEERVRRIPSTAMSRGLFFHLIDAQLARRGLAFTSGWQPRYGQGRRLHVLYPTTELARALAAGGALLHEDPREGLRELFRGAAAFVATTWFGRVIRSVLRPDPLEALRWMERSHDFACNHGVWRVEDRGAGHATLHMLDEYLWIDSVHRGGCEGMLEACGVHGAVEAETDDMFRGRLDVRWQIH